MKYLRASLSACLLVLLAACTEQPLPVSDPDSLRQIQTGPIVGKSDSYNTYTWLNIPYAKAPVDELRWRAPQAPDAWQDTRQSISYGQPCVQFWGMLSGVEGEAGDIVGSEDCLSLNIWAPKDIANNSKLPVMLWIHGGGNTVGTANTYQGHHLASDQNVIYVGINYRLGLFGSFAHRSLRNSSTTPEDASGNFAVLDMIAALQWVQDNIAEFGGDADNVTIFGESAGGRNVYSLITSPLAKGLFHKAIVQSGSTHTTDLAAAEAFVQSNGKGYPNTSNEVLAQALIKDHSVADREAAKSYIEQQADESLANYLRGLSPQALMNHIPHSGIGMFRAPQSLEDGYVLPDESLMKLFESSKQINHVPMLIGSNRDESKVFMAQDPQWVDKLLGVFPKIKDPEKYDRYASYYSQQWKTLAVDEPANRLSQHRPKQVFAYRFDWDNSPDSWLVDLPALLGAGHGLEISFIFGDFVGGLSIPQLNNDDNKADREQLSEAMMNYWGHFAHHGVPGKGTNGKFPHWHPWSSETDNLMILDGSEDQGIVSSDLRLSAADLKQRYLSDPAIGSAEERCKLYAQSFLVSFQARDFWNQEEYQNFGETGCAEFSPYQFK